MMVYAKYTKIDSISHPTVTKYTNLVTSVEKIDSESSVKLLMVTNQVQEVCKRNLLCSDVIFFLTILDNIHRFRVE